MLLAMRLPRLSITCLAAQRMTQRQQISSKWQVGHCGASHIMHANPAHQKCMFEINLTAALSEAALQVPILYPCSPGHWGELRLHIAQLHAETRELVQAGLQ